MLLEYYSNMCYPPLAESGTFHFPSSFPSKFFLVFCGSSQFCASSKMDAIRVFFLYKVLYDIYRTVSVIKKVSSNFFLDLRIIKFGSFWICLYINRLRSLR